MAEDTVTTNTDLDETVEGPSGIADREEEKGRSQVDREVAEELVARARADGLELIGADGVC